MEEAYKSQTLITSFKYIYHVCVSMLVHLLHDVVRHLRAAGHSCPEQTQEADRPSCLELQYKYQCKHSKSLFFII